MALGYAILPSLRVILSNNAIAFILKLYREVLRAQEFSILRYNFLSQIITQLELTIF